MVQMLPKGEILKVLKPYLEKMKQEMVKTVKETAPVIFEEGLKTAQGIYEDAQSEWKSFLEYLKREKVRNVVYHEVQFLNAETLLDFAKQYFVDGAEELYALKEQKGNDLYFQLVYGKDHEPFVSEQNQYVIIKAEGASADVLGLFAESELVILQ